MLVDVSGTYGKSLGNEGNMGCVDLRAKTARTFRFHSYVDRVHEVSASEVYLKCQVFPQ